MNRLFTPDALKTWSFAAAVLVAVSFATGCVSDVIESGKNADYDPNNVTGMRETLESRGMTTPKVVEIVPKLKYYGPACKITVTFNEKMNREDVESKFCIYDPGDKPYPGKFMWGKILGTDLEYFDYIPYTDTYLPSGDYKVLILKGAKSYGGFEMPRYESAFTFKPIPEEVN